tara:strand:- start:368 stop:1669 length:1302 start_codon:yes stop_codon:yes gene_type:complete
MKKLLIIFSLIIVLQTNSLAANLSQALLEAYTNNAELNAERENINVSKKNLDISKSEFLPTITLKGSKSSEDTSKLTNQDGTGATVTDVNPETRSVKIEQKIFQGFGGVADYEKNKIGLVLADAKLLQTEQKILLKAVEAFSGLIFAKEKFSINKRNVNLSERQVETDRIRLDRGQVSVADLAQSESSLAGSQAKFIQAKNNVITAKLNYENIIGPIQDSSDLNKNINLNLKIPLTLENAIQLSKTNNPDLIIAKLEYEQSKRDVKIAQSDLAPSATLSFESKETDDLSSTYDQQNKETVEATITWPIFSGGKNYAELSKSKNLRNRKKLLLDNALKVNDTNVASAWSNMKSNGSLLESVKLQVKAAEIANEGITAEYESGKGRSTLDVIQSNSILLNSKISLANSEREYLLSQFRFLQSVGILSANYLGLNK